MAFLCRICLRLGYRILECIRFRALTAGTLCTRLCETGFFDYFGLFWRVSHSSQIFDGTISRNRTAFAWLVAQAQVSTMLKIVWIYRPSVRFAGGLSFASDGKFLKFGKYQCPESIEIATTGLIATKIPPSVFWVIRDATVNTRSRYFQKSQLEGDFSFVLEFRPSLGQNTKSFFSKTGQ